MYAYCNPSCNILASTLAPPSIVYTAAKTGLFYMLGLTTLLLPCLWSSNYSASAGIHPNWPPGPTEWPGPDGTLSTRASCPPTALASLLFLEYAKPVLPQVLYTCLWCLWSFWMSGFFLSLRTQAFPDSLVQGVKLISTGGHISLVVAFKGLK